MTTTSNPDEGADVTTTVKRPLYEASTQFRNWRYSIEKLACVRQSLNEAAVTAIRNTFEAAEVTFI